uniref:Ribosomal RNA processing protein 1 n=1 Tax=Ascaris lumbricoides TaxID=6252 RepID=A0A0M3INZ7_ASCLU
MWMQDQMLLQEELADNIASLITLFAGEQQSVLFIKCMLLSLSNEWHLVDRWRMDKFLMLMRRLLRALFKHLRAKKWRQSLVDKYMEAFKECAISADKSFCDGLKFHFASIFLDELDCAGGLEPQRVTKLLEPFAQLLADKHISNYLFDSILQEIFLTILHGYAEEKAAAIGCDDESMEEGASDDRLKFNYGEIGQMLFDIGKRPEVKSDRRKRLYKVSKKFKAAEAGEDPFRMATKAETKLNLKIPRTEIVNAVSRLLNDRAKDAMLRKKAKERKKAAKRMATKAETKLNLKIPRTEIVNAVSRLLSDRAKDAMLRKKAKERKKAAKRAEQTLAKDEHPEGIVETGITKKMKKTAEQTLAKDEHPEGIVETGVTKKMKKTFAKDGRSGRKFKGTLIKKPRKGMKQRKLKKMK